ncbi:uncharacterized protein TM35_000092130 [Trypanosoma theileri]|uniref:Uncharacterized protein n=1 Tax=Trypanosoma theileri TaxID=67003 RepID=A0A1X0P0B4_9TRYP|nr:uncharacterized protein TM35_000092130 [Trypanosoma theileri]ORC90163.1 hypothetical protein TM35_000092130 [Trypanosoma theileri]
MSSVFLKTRETEGSHCLDSIVMKRNSAEDEEVDITEIGAAYCTSTVNRIETSSISSQKRVRSPQMSSSFTGEVCCSSNDDNDVDIVEHSNRLLELLRVRRREWNVRVGVSTESSSEYYINELSLKESNTQILKTSSPPLIQLPVTERYLKKVNVHRSGCESIREEEKEPSYLSSPPPVVHNVATQTQTTSIEGNNQMIDTNMAPADLLMLRLCELDALLHIFFS